MKTFTNLVFMLLTSSLYAAEAPVTAVKFVPNAERILVGSQSGLEVKSWPGIESVRRLESELLHIHDLAFSPDGDRVAVVGGTPAEEGTLEMFAWPSGKLLFRSSTNDDLIYAVDWSADSHQVATASLDWKVTVHNADSGETNVQIEGHSRPVTAVCFLSDGKTLVSSGIDQSVRVWELPSGNNIRAFNNHTQPVHDVALRPSSDPDVLPMIASVSRDRTARLWQPTIGRMVRFCKVSGSVPLAVDWTSSGDRIVVSCTDGQLRTIDPDTVEILQESPAIDGWAYCVAVHSGNQEAVVGGDRGQLARVVLLPKPEE